MIITTFIWGATFVLVKDALLNIPPFAFSAWRFLIASLISLIIFFRHLKGFTRLEIIGGIFTGIFLFSGFGFQTFGLTITTASKSAFITSISIIMVPVILVMLRIQKVRIKIWLSMILAIIGLFFVLNPSGDGVNNGDLFTLGCALSFALHIIVQDKYVQQSVNIYRFFIIQGFTVAILSFGNHFILESQPTVWSNHLVIVLVITALFATLFGFTVMIAAQKILSPSRTAIILSLEPLFAAAIAIVFAGEWLSLWGWFGGVLIVAGVILAEWGDKS
ncbi:MAG: DMT family transporter [Candidatus Marinimicrobia bacterium]|jgi:drug/metabolite transporter (DMT)-like permease|nr:DMT family transporter [Candidatus Neomarinimicrobiota bacterium]MBT3633190.1 DMT family transporter [Candidatus Neomarinimicrobiota bacterium]MBT3682209.1 DMT family transporter [Candidatus Neomarinimicrobiota bacterium]MBT3758790.1 DMT family transporter [Candidatus Neomarinimicrobiota bacterium]MBT3895335.1 DMT family transporter [Candidatus Neomarinimicrobiota bacterium]